MKIIVFIMPSPDYKNITDFWKVSRLPLCLPLVRATLRMIMEHWWNNTERVKQKYSDKPEKFIFVYQKSHMF
jgi:hypothetical protein